MIITSDMIFTLMIHAVNIWHWQRPLLAQSGQAHWTEGLR